MSFFPPQDSPIANGLDFDGATSVNGAEVPLGTIQVPANFVGYVEAEMAARVIQASPAEESPWVLSIRTFISKGADGTSVAVLGTPSLTVSGKSYIVGNYTVAATLLPSASDPTVMQVLVHGRAGTTVYFDGHGAIRGRVQSGDG